MKKILTVLVLGLFLSSVVGCGDSKTTSGSGTTPATPTKPKTP